MFHGTLHTVQSSPVQLCLSRYSYICACLVAFDAILTTSYGFDPWLPYLLLPYCTIEWTKEGDAMHPSMHAQRRETAALGWLGHTTDTRFFLWSGSRSRSRSFMLTLPARCCCLLAAQTHAYIHGMQPYGKRGSQTVRASDSKSDEGARGCLVASGREQQMSWQCIALASCLNPIRTQSHPPANPCPPRNGPRPSQASPNLRRPRHAAATRWMPAHAQGPNQAPRPTPPCVPTAPLCLPAVQHPASSQQAPAVAPSMSVQPTASGLASPSARSLPLPCSLALLLCSSRRLSPFLLPGPPERPDRSRTNPPLRPMAQAVRLPSCAASPDMQQPRASVS
ncbi:hypothetical protein J3E68DRAFT_388236 [Trichoderma sp. SZMC 28012]